MDDARVLEHGPWLVFVVFPLQPFFKILLAWEDDLVVFFVPLERAPWSRCGEHGPRVVKLLWAGPGSRFTVLFEQLAVEWSKAASQKAVG